MNDLADLLSTSTIWARKPNWATSPQRDFDMAREVEDVAPSGLSITNILDYLAHSVEYRYRNSSKVDESALLAFWQQQHGRHLRFWLPLWRSDFHLVLPVLPYEDTLVVDATGVATVFQGYERIYLELTDGTLITRHVTAVVDNLDGTETLYLETFMDRSIAIADVAMFGRLLLVRFDSDELLLEHVSAAVSEFTLHFRELVREYSLSGATS
jgi:hypothetical protein